MFTNVIELPKRKFCLLIMKRLEIYIKIKKALKLGMTTSMIKKNNL